MKIKSLLITLFCVAPTLALAAGQIQVLNIEGQPVAGAEILVGQAPGEPFENNIFYTDADGRMEVPAEWKTPLPLTVTAENYVVSSFQNIDPKESSFRIHRIDGRNWHEIKGDAVNFKGIRRDGKVDFALVFPAMEKRDLMQFDLASVMSAETDTIKVITEKVDLPSNISLPKQTESYILPVKLNKPTYRMFVSQTGEHRMTAMHGRFPLKKVVNDLRKGKSIFEVINHFKFKGAGQVDVNVTGPTEGEDIDVNQIKFDAKVQVQAPDFNPEFAMISVALNDQNGLFFPSDLKGIKPGESKELSVTTNVNKHYILSVLMEDIKDLSTPKLVDTNSLGFELTPAQKMKQVADLCFKGDRVSFSFGDEAEEIKKATTPAVTLAVNETSTGAVPQFIGLVEPPRVIGQDIHLSPPASNDAITPVATYLVLSEIEKPGQGEYSAERRYRLWEVFTPGWVDKVQLPSRDIETSPNKKYRWEVLYLGRLTDLNNPDGYFLDHITHVSRNSLDF